VGHIDIAYRRERDPHSLAKLAARQHGVVSKRQLRRLGFSDGDVCRRVRSGTLHPLYRGVYAVGHPAIGWDARCLAAVMACGSRAVLSHRAAARRWLLITAVAAIEITTASRRRPKQGFILHRSRSLGPEDRTVVDAIPCTTVARTLVDLAEVLSERRLADAVHQAEFHRVLDVNEVERVLERVPGRTGRHRLRRSLAAYAPEPLRVRNEAERLVHDLCIQHGLPKPEANASIQGHEVDLYWPQAALVVELDGGPAHLTRRAFHEDRRRDRFLATRGIQVLRVTSRELDLAIRQVRQVYARRAAAATRT
jgi:very-short-patch-repair endonuclease